QRALSALENLSSDVKDVRERVIQLEAKDVTGQIATLRADFRTVEERFRRGIDDVEDKLADVQKAVMERVGRIETDNAETKERVSGLRTLVYWAGGILSGVIVAVVAAMVLASLLGAAN